MVEHHICSFSQWKLSSIEIMPLLYHTPLVCYCEPTEVTRKLMVSQCQDQTTQHLKDSSQTNVYCLDYNLSDLVSRTLHNLDPESQAYRFPPTMTCPFTCSEMRQDKTCALDRSWWQHSGCCMVSDIFAVWPQGSPTTNILHLVAVIWQSDGREWENQTNKKTVTRRQYKSADKQFKYQRQNLRVQKKAAEQILQCEHSSEAHWDVCVKAGKLFQGSCYKGSCVIVTSPWQSN